MADAKENLQETERRSNETESGTIDEPKERTLDLRRDERIQASQGLCDKDPTGGSLTRRKMIQSSQGLCDKDPTGGSLTRRKMIQSSQGLCDKDPTGGSLTPRKLIQPSQGAKAEKYRTGACDNCGALSHKRKFCMERPRKIGAKYTNKHIAADEKFETFELDYDGKRDRWNGYDFSTYHRVTELFEAKEDARMKYLKNQKLKQLEEKLNNLDGKVDERSKMNSSVKTTPIPGTFRVREDTAKYLLNLDANSAYYDPKSRSMREEPYRDADPNENFIRGDNQSVREDQLYKDTRRKVQTQSKETLNEKYGNAATLDNEVPMELLLGQSDREVEYDRAGRIIAQEVIPPTSKYDEDVQVNNHTTVWGSWWNDFKWGYKCCKQTIRNSYCTATESPEKVEALDLNKKTTSVNALNEEDQSRIEEDLKKHNNS